MGLFNKIKGILFEEVEEDEVENNTKKESKEVQKPIAERIEPQRKETIVTEIPKAPVNVAPKEEKHEDLSERELVKSD